MQIPKIVAPLVRVFEALSDAVGSRSKGGRKITAEEWPEIWASARGVVDQVVAEPIAVGDPILVRIADGEQRPGVVVRVWSETVVNAQVFVDGTNDARHLLAFGVERPPVCVWWVTSLARGEGVGQWSRA